MRKKSLLENPNNKGNYSRYANERITKLSVLLLAVPMRHLVQYGALRFCLRFTAVGTVLSYLFMILLFFSGMWNDDFNSKQIVNAACIGLVLFLTFLYLLDYQCKRTELNYIGAVTMTRLFAFSRHGEIFMLRFLWNSCVVSKYFKSNDGRICHDAFKRGSGIGEPAWA